MRVTMAHRRCDESPEPIARIISWLGGIKRGSDDPIARIRVHREGLPISQPHFHAATSRILL